MGTRAPIQRRRIPTPFTPAPNLNRPIEDFYNLNQIVVQLRTLHQQFLDQEGERGEAFAQKIQEVCDLMEKVEGEIERIQTIKKGEKGNDGVSPNIAEVIQAVLQRIRQPEDGRKGKDADEEKVINSVLNKLPSLINKKDIVKEVLSFIKPAKPGENGKNAEPKEVFDLFLAYLKDNPLKVKDIADLDNTLRSMWNQIGMAKGGVQESQKGTKWKMRGGGDTIAAGTGYTLQRNANGTVSLVISGAGTTSVVDEVPTGSGTAFTLAHTPAANTLKLYRGGARITTTSGDYTLAGANITLTFTLQSGETLTADYNY